MGHDNSTLSRWLLCGQGEQARSFLLRVRRRLPRPGAAIRCSGWLSSSRPSRETGNRMTLLLRVVPLHWFGTPPAVTAKPRPYPFLV